MVILGTIIAIAFIAFMLLNNKNMRTYNQYMKRMKKLQETVKNFNATQQYTNQNMAIAINKNEKKILVSIMKKGEPIPLTYTFNEILDCEIIEYEIDENKNKLNGANVARILGDNVGTVLGKTSEEWINRIDLKISFKDSNNPSVLLNFLYWEVNKESEEYQKAYADVSRWHGIVSNIIKFDSNKSNAL